MSHEYEKYDNVWTYTCKDILDGFPKFRDNITPGSNHYIMLTFSKEHTEYSWVWNIEYDVYFSGPWSVVFDYYDAYDIDFIATHIKHIRDCKDWYWWCTMPKSLFSFKKLYKSFNPIYRISRRAINILLENISKEVFGHHEYIIPSVLVNSGLKLGQIQLFLDQTIPNSFSHKVSLVKDECKTTNKLYHPIKE